LNSISSAAGKEEVGERGDKLCGTAETTDHILFQCPLAVFLWAFLKETFNWQLAPIVSDDIFDRVLRNGKSFSKRLLLVICAGAMWALWKTRNDMVFNAKVVAGGTQGDFLHQILEAVAERERQAAVGRNYKHSGGGRRPPSLMAVVKSNGCFC
jgi:hypothetical protein